MNPTKGHRVLSKTKKDNEEIQISIYVALGHRLRLVVLGLLL